MPVRADLDPWVLFIAIMALLISIWTAQRVVVTHELRSHPTDGLLGITAVAFLGFVIVGSAFGHGKAFAPFLAYLLAAVPLSYCARQLSTPGSAWLAIQFIGLVTGWFWICLLINDAQLPFLFEVLALLSLTLGLGVALLGCVERIAREAVFTHRHWRLPTKPIDREPGTFRPRVSIHLPCYAEPPEVVKETMNRLAMLDYDNFEVLVCDNNTKDEALWRPLQRHAEFLNQRMGHEVFRFFHVAPLNGAKAGALNWLLDRMDPETDLIAVVDADYLSERGFLARLVPFFENPQIAYLQTPHDYRDYQGDPYLTSCHWEYMPNNKIEMLGVHEYGGAFTIGTMCILRADVLRSVGGWAEWCLTEDSEISVRLRAAGYRGIYLGETFGRGLIPATFDDYKKQRFRWTAGPVQQLVRHWRLFRPSPWAHAMPGWTKMLEVLRCISPLQTLFQLATGLVVLGAVITASATGAIGQITIPAVAWAMISLAMATTFVRIWHRYKLSGCRHIPDMIRGEIARASLSYVVLVSGVAGLSKKPLAWRRTPKFFTANSLSAEMAAATPEIILGIIGMVLAGTVLAMHSAIGFSFAVLASLSLSFLALRLLCAPYMAWLCWNTRRTESANPQAGSPSLASSGG